MSDAQSSGQLEVGSENNNNNNESSRSDLKKTEEASIRSADNSKKKEQADEEETNCKEETNDNDFTSQRNELASGSVKNPSDARHSIQQSTSSRRARPPVPVKRLELRRVPPPPGGPPKRPDQLPAAYATRTRFIGALPSGAVGGVSGSEPVANRYSWAQLQHWRRLEGSVASPAAAANLPSSLSAHFQGASRGVALVVNPMQMVNLSEHTKSKLIKIIEALKRFSEQWFSHVLLLMFLAVYACLGAYVFISFEASTEQWEKEVIVETRKRLTKDIWNSARKDNQTTFSQLMIQELESYERLLARACASGMTSNSLENQWTFWGALFYSMTVFTTIGYGHLTPVTFAGRVATMVYAIFGIPILLMVLADLGKLLTRIIKFAFKQFRLMRHKLLHWRASVRTRRIISERFHEGVATLRSAFSRALTRLRPSWFRCPTRLRSLLTTIGKYFERKPPKNKEEAVTNTDSVSDSATQQQIVTPPKQTKPVSPSVNQSRPGFGPLAGFGSAAHHHGYQHHHAHPSLARTHSPGRQGGSGASLSNRHHRKNSSLAKQHRNFQVSRSSSSSAVAAPSQNLNSPSSVQSNKSVISPNLAQPETCQPENVEVEDFIKDGSEKEMKVGTDEKSICPKAEKLNATTSANRSQHGDDENEETNFVEDELLEDDVSVILGDEEEDDKFQLEDDDFDIPVSFALFLLVTYMMFGAVVFSIWEGWNFFDSLYFVFISMSTIGFGDLVPQHPKRMIGTFIYLLFGLALTSMCINVVQEKIHATFLRAKMQIGEKMGLDLDQIMADDYYEGSLMDEYCDADCLSVTGHSNLNESGLNEAQSPHNDTTHASDTNNNNNNQTAIELNSANSVRLSRSSHSFRSKSRRQAPAALPAHSNSSLGGGSMLRRQTSKRLSRQVTPSSPTAAITTSQDRPNADSVESPTSSVAHSPTAAVDEYRSSGQAAQAQEAASAEQVVEDCTEPQVAGSKQLHTSNGTNQMTTDGRPRLSGTRSHPEDTSADNDEQQQSTRQDKSCKIFVTSDGQRKEEPRSRSANSSRRSSVSQELNQLDDLILTLSLSAANSQDGRFGPLLGIPGRVGSPKSSSATSINRSHSNSPITSNTLRLNSASQNNNNTMLPIPRRGTSMTSRRPVTQKESSGLMRKTSSPSSPTSSNFTIVRAPIKHNSTSSKESSKQVSIDLAMENSQKAIDELEAVKLSIV